jgi:hypothetical protein
MIVIFKLFQTVIQKNFRLMLKKIQDAKKERFTCHSNLVLAIYSALFPCVWVNLQLTEIFSNIWTSRFRRRIRRVSPVVRFGEAHVQVGKTDGAAYSCHALDALVWQQLLGATQACSSGTDQLSPIIPSW